MCRKNTPHQWIVEPVESNVKQGDSEGEIYHVEIWFATEKGTVSVDG